MSESDFFEWFYSIQPDSLTSDDSFEEFLTRNLEEHDLENADDIFLASDLDLQEEADIVDQILEEGLFY